MLDPGGGLLPGRTVLFDDCAVLEASGRGGGYELAVLAFFGHWDRGPGCGCFVVGCLVQVASGGWEVWAGGEA